MIMGRHVKVQAASAAHGFPASFVMYVNLWGADVAHKDTCCIRVQCTRPTRKQVRDFYNDSRVYWRRGVRK